MKPSFKLSFKPVCFSVLASLICVQSAQAFNLNDLNPLNIGKKIVQPLRPRPSQPLRPTQDIDPADGQPRQYQQTNYVKLPPASPQLNTAIQSVLTSIGMQIDQTSVDIKNVRALYALHQNKAFWTNDSGLTEMGQALQQNLNDMAEVHGFSPNYYLTADVIVRMEQRDLQSLAELDILLTQGYMLFLKDMTTGRINPKDPSQGLTDIEMKKNAPPALDILNSITKTPDTLTNGMYDLVPKAVGYTALVNTLVKLQMGRDAGGWQAFSEDRPGLRPGASHPNVVAVRQRLVDMGFLPLEAREDQSLRYDENMYRAVYKFQQLNFLGADGIIGNGTYKALDFTIDKAINQTRANLEKWRLLPRTFPARYLFVDMGRQELDIMENNMLVDRMRVVVGKDLHGTPTMTDQVTQVTLSPYWYPPTSIIVNEMIPKILANPDYPSLMRLRIFDGNREVDVRSVNWSQYTLQNPPPFQFRQDSGPENSLGLVKFELSENNHAIYLHDTDNHQVFNQSIRYLSHGCIRLQRPFDLAAYLLRDKGYQADQLNRRAQDDRVPEKIPVNPIPVYIFGTTMVNYPGGLVTFGIDIYGQDDRIIKALDQMANPVTAEAALLAAPTK